MGKKEKAEMIYNPEKMKKKSVQCKKKARL